MAMNAHRLRVQLFAVIRKEVLQTVRDRRVMFMLIVAPLLQLIAFGYAVNLEVDRVPTAVVDLDRTPESRELARRLAADGTLLRVADAADPAEANRLLDDGDIAAALVLPRDLGADLARGRPVEVQVLLDGTDPNRATVAAAAVARYAAAVGGGVPAVSVAPRILYNPAMKTPPFMIPGVMSLLLIIVTTVVSAMGLSREKESGTLEQVLVTPIPPAVLLLGKIAPFAAIGLFDIGLALTAGSWIFGLPIRGSLALVFGATLLYLLTTLGLGLLVSALSKTQQQSFLGGFLFVIPAILLSGAMTPVRAMPGWLQAVTLVNPVRHFVDVLRAVLLRGAGAADLWPQLLALGAFGIVIFALATLGFHKRMA
jgi:ABC-2 type transport system permease protein